ncbi:4-(cytidine 5'-diphospho)-2-C-methyl-D-erythritol kinase [Abyssisolibacter fermentans]|uniref:4-(cytidine 5'-diphospho)-2-C-methyl-D-erythritol kinase n=1 Tax=Abyssisolibacter fermentans TaxID=1766203 RepID=UPI00082E3E75|nr:4-(cytidine 5'-diphospho)-2-C-methyl-D-erythritol kinase [Abyssisolibacter fermentans]
MNSLLLKAYAKINLSLDVISKREDGYHNLKMIMQQIDIYDKVTLIEEGNTAQIECNCSKVPTDASNLAYKAWNIMCTKYNIQKGVRVIIEKNIPIAAGLAGGSSDAAAVLIGLNKLWNLKLTKTELMEIGVLIGADVPYCICGGTALAQGIGNEITELKSFKNRLVLIAKPDIDVSTAYVYNNLQLSNVNDHPNIDKIVESIEKNDLYTLSKNMGNVLETVTIKKYDIIKTIKEKMINNGSIGSLMSGSGPTVFGLFDNEEDLENCYCEIKKFIPFVKKTKSI